jgi:hypothetical protein
MATTTNYSWSTPDNTAYVKDGASAIRSLGSSVDSTLYTALGGAYPGLRLVSKTTIGSAVTGVTVSTPFSATYAGYKILVVGTLLSDAGTNLHWQLAASGTVSTTLYSYGIAAMDYAANAFTYIRGQNASQIVCGMAVSAGSTISTGLEILNPFSANDTYFIGLNYIGNSAGYGGMGGGIHQVGTS